MSSANVHAVEKWLSARRFSSLTRREHDWVIEFDRESWIVVSCLWRLLRSNRIEMTSDDHGQRFGLPEEIDAAEYVNRLLKGFAVTRVALREGTLDLCLTFEGDLTLEVLPSSSGYEAWDLGDVTGFRMVAVGSGSLKSIGSPVTDAEF